MKTTVNFFRTLLLAVLTLTFGACGEDSLLSELGLDGQTSTKADGAGEVWDGTVAENFADGNGTAENPYQIANGAQLKRFAAIVNGTDGMARNTAACGKLTADILLNNTEGWENWNESTEGLNSWTPIGSGGQPFTGTLDGDGHSVSGIYINSTADYQGLVGYLGGGGTLQNLGVKASYIKGGYYVGGVCGGKRGTVTNCYNSGTVAGSNQVGGVCGLNFGNVTNCYNTGSVTGTNNVGGVCGGNYDGTVTNCYYLIGTAAGGINGSDAAVQAEAKTKTEFASGEVAYLLQNGQAEQVWGQTIGTDDYPVLGGEKVLQIGNGYANELKQDGDFYLISTADELRLFASMVNGGQTSINGKLTADILLNNTEGWENWNESTEGLNSWTPIGSDANRFTGILDGDGHSVSGIYINSEAECQGLVGVLGEGGTLQNLGVKASYIKGLHSVGGVCGISWGTVTNCYNSGSLAGSEGVGGLCGTNGGTVTNCNNTGSVTGNNMVGGLCGYNNSNVINCYNTANVTGTGDYVGGLCGWNEGPVTNCYNTGNVTGNNMVGGLCGYNWDNVTNCYNSGSVAGSEGVGGLCGQNYATVTNCYNSGSVAGDIRVGGVCGGNYDGPVTNCYNTGSVTGTGDYVGGLCGENYGTVTNCYYLDTCGAAGEGASKTADNFKSGEVASLLGDGWGQTIGTDDYPVLDADGTKRVYAVTLYQGSDAADARYLNSNGTFPTLTDNAIALVDADSPFKTGKNIIVKDGDNSYTCAELVLTDGADFYTPVKFTATKATYTRSPKVWAKNDGSGSGWETICLPFSGTLYAGDVAKQPVDVASNNGAYWLRSLTGFETPNTLIFASPATAADNQIEAGVPYIIALPGTSFGSESLEGQTISVRGTDVAVTNVAQSVQPEGSLFAFTGTFATKACDAASYRLNSENGSDRAGDLFVFDTNKLTPFRCRIDVKGLIIGGASTRSASGLPKELRIGQ